MVVCLPVSANCRLVCLSRRSKTCHSGAREWRLSHGISGISAAAQKGVEHINVTVRACHSTCKRAFCMEGAELVLAECKLAQMMCSGKTSEHCSGQSLLQMMFLFLAVGFEILSVFHAWLVVLSSLFLTVHGRAGRCPPSSSIVLHPASHPTSSVKDSAFSVQCPASSASFQRQGGRQAEAHQ